MAGIVSAQVLGIRTTENTKTYGVDLPANNVSDIGKRVNINSTEYSVLVFYDDGTTEIVEGDSNAINHLMRYVPRQNSTDSITKLLENHELKMKALFDDEVLKVFDALRPVPEVYGLREDKAIALLQSKDFVVHLVNEYPANIPLGVVYACKRQTDAPMTVDLDIRHALPNVVNLLEEQALAKLRAAGFDPTVTRIYAVEYTDHHVLTCKRKNATTMNVDLEVTSPAPSLVGLTQQEAIRQLEEAGFVYRTAMILHEDIPAGIVIEAKYESGKVAVLTVSRGPQFLYATNAQATWNTFPDSTEDNYPDISVWVDRDTRKLTIQLELLSNCKKPHTLTGSCIVNGDLAWAKPLKSSPEIKPNESFMFQINNRLEQMDSLPTQLTVKAETTSGLFKQAFMLEYSFTIAWPPEANM